MTTISLFEYNQKIDKLIEDDHASEAVVHCRHILHLFPRHAPTYQLLAKALLEQNEFGDAAGIFQRVLSTDPGDFISHAGLSVIYKEQADLSQSLWHLKRAFDVFPYNGAIRQELIGLLQESENEVVDPLPLTPGALARLNLNSEMYSRAAQELRQALKTSDDRVDLKVLLAESLWRDGQRVEAVALCHQILETLPDCISANAILADIWLHAGRIQEAQPYLKKLLGLTQIDRVNLNPESPVGQAFLANGAPPIPKEVELEFLEDADPYAVESEMLGGETAVSADGEAIDTMYDWLTAVESESNIVPEEEKKKETDWLVDPEISMDSSGPDEAADWLTDLDSLPAGEEMTDEDFANLFTEYKSKPGKIEPVSEKDAAWLVETDPGVETAEDSLDWLTEATGSDFDALQLTPEGAAEYLADTGEESNWLANLDEVTLESESTVINSDISDLKADIPDWLSGSEPDSKVSESLTPKDDAESPPEPETGELEQAVPAEPGIESEELPGWLTGGLDETIVSDAEGDEEELPGWLTGELDEKTVSGTEENEEELPGWLTGELDETIVSQPEEQEEKLPGWLTGGLDESAVAETGEPEDELPDWLTGDLNEPLVESVIQPNLDSNAPGPEAGTTAEEIIQYEKDAGENADLPELASGDKGAVAPSDSETAVEQDLSDWLVSEVNDSQAQIPSGQPDAVDEDAELVDWLISESNAVEIEVGEKGSAVVESEGLPDWLAFEETPDQAQADSDDNHSAEVVLDWLTDMATDTSGLMEDNVSLDNDELTPDLPEESAPQPAPPPEEEADLSWLDDEAGANEKGVDSTPPADERLLDEDQLPTKPGAETAQSMNEKETNQNDELADASLHEADQGVDTEPEALEPADIPDWVMGLAPPESEESPQEPVSSEADDLITLTNLLDAAVISDTNLEIGDLDSELDWLAPNDEDVVEAEASKIVTGWLNSDPGLLEETGNWADGMLDSAESLAEDEAEELDGALDWLEGLAASSPTEEPAKSVEPPEPDKTVPSDIDLDRPSEEVVQPDDLLSAEEINLKTELDDEMAWLGDLEVAEDEPKTVMAEEAVSPELDEPPAPEEAPTTIDTDLTWLDSLAVGAELPETDELETAPGVELAAEITDQATVSPADESEVDSEPVYHDEYASTVSWLEKLTTDHEPGSDNIEEGEPDLTILDEFIDSDTKEDVDDTAVPEKIIPPADEDELEETAVPEDLSPESELEQFELSSTDSAATPSAPPEDLDEAMTWLEGLAAEQGAPVEELPSIAQAIEAESEQAMSEGLAAEELGETKDDLADAESWLEELSAEQEPSPEESRESDAQADLEPATPADQPEAEPLYQPPEWVSVSQLVPPGDVEDVPEEVDDAMNWIEDILVDEGIELDEPAVEGEGTETSPELSDADQGTPELAETESLPKSAEITTISESTIVEEPALAAEELVLSSETEEIEAVDETAVSNELGDAAEVDESGESPMYQPPEWVSVSKLVPPGDVEDVPEEVDDAMAWLQELAEEQGATLDEKTAEPAEMDQAEIEDSLLEIGTPAKDLEEPVETADSDLVDALNWLESIAEPQPAGAEEVALDQLSIDELDSDLDFLEQLDVNALVEDEDGPQEEPAANEEVVLEFDTDMLGTMPDDPDEAMNWLAQFSGPDTAVDLTEELETEDEAETIAPEPPELEEPGDAILGSMPEDPDAAMDWLSQIAAEDKGEPEMVDESISREEPLDTTNKVESESEGAIETAPESEYLTEMPEDPDEAMAWLEKLAARQGAPAEELPSVTEEEAAKLVETAVPEEISPELLETSPEPGFDETPAPASADILPSQSDQELAEALPDWLTASPDETLDSGHTDWLESLEEPDVTGWLEGEEDVASTGIIKKDEWTSFTSETRIETGPLPSLEPTLPTEAQKPEEPSFEDEIVLPDTGPLSSAMVVDQGKLAGARKALEFGDYQGALEDYRNMVEAGEGLGMLIRDLETAVVEHEERPLLRHLLGDAYMRNGQLQKALETYRYALDLL